MKNFIITVAVMHIACLALSQEVVFKKEMRLQRGLNDKREVCPVVDESGNSVSLFMLDSKSMRAYMFNDNLEQVDSLTTSRIDDNFPELLGGSQMGSTFNLFFTNASESKFTVASFDFENNKIGTFLPRLELNRNEYVGSLAHKSKFYIFSIIKSSSKLRLHVFTDPSTFSTHEYDFASTNFGSPSRPSSLYKVAGKSYFVTIDNEVPNAIDQAAKKNKVYAFDDKIVFTIDSENIWTTAITIDLASMKESIKNYDQPRPGCGTMKVGSSSYIHQNKLYQFAICAQQMAYTITDLNDGKRLQTFIASNGDDNISFRNTAIIQQGGGPWSMLAGEERELTKPKQFLRKVAASEPGISAYKSPRGIEVTLGGFLLIQNYGGGYASGFAPGSSTISTPNGPVIIPQYRYSPTYAGFNSYVQTRSVTFKSLLNTNDLSHQAGEVPKNAFDKAGLLATEIETDITAETVFRKDGKCFLGYYLKSEKTYVIRRFED